MQGYVRIGENVGTFLSKKEKQFFDTFPCFDKIRKIYLLKYWTVRVIQQKKALAEKIQNEKQLEAKRLKDFCKKIFFYLERAVKVEI